MAGESARGGAVAPAAKPATQPERTEASRGALIEATIALLAEEGYRAATVARIQEASGLSRGLVGYHFGSKARLMEAVVEHIRVGYREQTAADAGRVTLSGLDQVLGLFEAYLTRLGANPNPAKVMLVLATESAVGAPDVRRAVQDAYAVVRDNFAQMLAAGIADGTVRDDLDPRAHAGVLQGMLRGIVLQYLLDPDGFDLGSTRNAALAALRHDVGVR